MKTEKLTLNGVNLVCEFEHIPDKKRSITYIKPDMYIIEIVADIKTHKCVLRRFIFDEISDGKTIKESNIINANKARAQWVQLKQALQH